MECAAWKAAARETVIKGCELPLPPPLQHEDLVGSMPSGGHGES